MPVKSPEQQRVPFRERRWVRGTALAAGASLCLGIYAGTRDSIGEIAAIPGDIIEAIPDIDIEIPEVVLDVSPKPMTVIAAINHESYEIESELALSCRKQVEVAVDVEGGREGYRLFNLGLGSAELRKQLFGDILLCADEDVVNQIISANESVDPITGEVTSVDITVPGLDVFHPRVDHLAVENCVDGNPGDSPEEIDIKVAQYLADIAAGEQPACDDGFDVNGIGPDDLAELIQFGNSAAQLAMVIDANPKEILEQADQQWGQEVLDELASQTRYQNADINVIVERRGDAETVQKRLDEIMSDLMARFSVVLVAKQDDGTLVLHVEDSAGSWANVPLTSYAELTVDEANLVLENIGTIDEQ